MSEINQRQLDIWGIYRDPEHLGSYKTPEEIDKRIKKGEETNKPYAMTALDIITKAYSEHPFEKPVEFVTNCISRVTLNGKELQRHFDTLLIAEEAGIVVMLSSDLRDQELGVSAQDIYDYLMKSQIPFEWGIGREVPKDYDDPSIPEIWFARDEGVLRMGIDEAIDLGADKITFDPDAEVKVSLGFINSKTGKYEELFGFDSRGLAMSKTNWITAINEGYKDNIPSKRAQEVVDEANLRLKK